MHRWSLIVRCQLAALAVNILLACSPPAARAVDAVSILETPGGVRFGLQGEKAARPAPTLFVLATGIEQTLPDPVYNKVGHLLAEQGWLCVGIDLPCHGQETRPNEPAGLDGWAARLKSGENFMAEFTSRCTAVLDYLIEQGYTDPNRVAVCGTSRGGFSALHFAVAEPRVAAVAALAPVTELPILREFKGLEEDPLTRSLALETHAQALAGRAVWVCIGNNDDRVGTDACIAFSRRVVAESIAASKSAPIEMHVMVTEGHRTHPTAHDEIAAWIAQRFVP